MLADAKVALSFSQDYFKAHLRHGEASVELGKKLDTITMIDEGIVSLQKALYLCWKLGPQDSKYGQKANFEKQISKQILKAKKIKWYKEQQIQQTEQEIILAQLKENLTVSEEDISTIDTDEMIDSGTTPGDQDSRQVNLKIFLKVQKQFKKEKTHKQQIFEVEVPDYLLCRITDELMDEPVILESGFTYEREQIL